jgi:hypothetical protein
MMEPHGNKIRELTGGVKFDRETSNQIGEYQAQCARRNLQGKCAVPGVLDEFGQNMSQEDFARHVASGRDPRQVYKQNPNQFVGQFAGLNSAFTGK